MSCNCCDGNCPECVDVPETACCNIAAPIVEYECVHPAPTNRTTEVIGNRYGCDLFSLCSLPEGITLDPDQGAAVKNLLQSMLVYFHGYSVLNTGNCMDDRIMYGRDEMCEMSWMGGIYPAPNASSACAPTEGTPLPGGCDKGCEGTPVYRERWTPTLDNACCQIPVVDENGDPVLDGEGNPTFEAAKLMFGAVPDSHPYLTQYGGTPNMPIDFDRIEPAMANKVGNLIKKAICEIEAAVA